MERKEKERLLINICQNKHACNNNIAGISPANVITGQRMHTRILTFIVIIPIGNNSW